MSFPISFGNKNNSLLKKFYCSIVVIIFISYNIFAGNNDKSVLTEKEQPGFKENFNEKLHLSFFQWCINLNIINFILYLINLKLS